jgi:hypothetical protein
LGGGELILHKLEVLFDLPDHVIFTEQLLFQLGNFVIVHLFYYALLGSFRITDLMVLFY